MAVILRPPIAAGTFYELDPNMLRKQLDFYFRNAVVKSKKADALVRLVPHSPYIHSGQIAAYSFVNLTKSNFVIIGSNHSLTGANFALTKNSLWKTPIGEVLVDDNFADKLLRESNLIEFDAIPHEDEFSIEVQLPFLLHKFGDVKILPLLINNQIPDETLLENCRLVGSSIAKLMKKEGGWKLIGSSDLSRNIEEEKTERIDKILLRYIKKLDSRGFLKAVNELNANVCGYAVIATTISVAKELGAKKAEVLKYGTSAALDEGEVTGYASVIFY
ncbi:MAG: AmmeMemoRadiSam system protein B [Candidatus Aenigmatarchaeota archaeon]|nr:AmmeMemoRadiSam system protein B [Candidatus Aenigmarchaeota archaeon]